jgi:hypothetical protein
MTVVATANPAKLLRQMNVRFSQVKTRYDVMLHP